MRRRSYVKLAGTACVASMAGCAGGDGDDDGDGGDGGGESTDGGSIVFLRVPDGPPADEQQD